MDMFLVFRIVYLKEGTVNMKNCDQIDRAIKKTTLYFLFLLLGMMLSGNPVLAQGTGTSEKSDSSDEFMLEEISVTGSRIRSSGMETPTPVTVVTTDEIQFLSPNAMVDGLAELPQFAVGMEGGADGSATTQNPSAFFTSTGAGNLSLRGLQSKRTLIFWMGAVSFHQLFWMDRTSTCFLNFC